jgi:hypothetical protein
MEEAVFMLLRFWFLFTLCSAPSIGDGSGKKRAEGSYPNKEK